jgi:hypothetical protein
MITPSTGLGKTVKNPLFPENQDNSGCSKISVSEQPQYFQKTEVLGMPL